MTISIFGAVSSIGVLVAKSTLLLALGWSATRFLRRAPASTRHAVWLTTMSGVLLMPALDRFGPISLRVLPAGALSSVAHASPIEDTELAPSRLRPTQAAA